MGTATDLFNGKEKRARTYEDAVLERQRDCLGIAKNAASIEFEILPSVMPPECKDVHVDDFVKNVGFANSLCAVESSSMRSVLTWSPRHTEPIDFDELTSEVNSLMYEFSPASDLFGLAALNDQKVFELGSSILALGTIIYDSYDYPICPVFERNEETKKLGLYTSKASLIFPDDVLLLRDTLSL